MEQSINIYEITWDMGHIRKIDEVKSHVEQRAEQHVIAERQTPEQELSRVRQQNVLQEASVPMEKQEDLHGKQQLKTRPKIRVRHNQNQKRKQQLYHLV